MKIPIFSRRASAWLVGAVLASACTQPPPAAVAGSGDPVFVELARQIVEERFKTHPSEATDLGIHRYDDQLEHLSKTAITAESARLSSFRSSLAAIDPSTLTMTHALDREQLIHAMDASVIALDTIKLWAKDPDAYSSAATTAAYVIMKREFAPAAQRLQSLIARERKIPALLEEARRNLEHPIRIYTEIAIEQIDGNISFFKNDLPAAFQGVADRPLLAEFKESNDSVIAALRAYKSFLQRELLPRATNDFAFGADTYAKAMAASEGVDVPLERLLQIAEADRRKNEELFQATAKTIDAKRSADQVLGSLQLDHPPAARLLRATQDTLDSIRLFITDRRIMTIPPTEPIHVHETPPFMRSTTSASMDTPGPFETAPLQAFYYMTLPDPRKSRAEQADYMRQWYYPAITNVSVHEVYPGHFVQFVYAKGFPSDVRKVFGTRANVEGWAHYCEQMMLDEGFHAGDPKFRLAQLQDALLRDVRFIAGIKMHTRGMTLEEATNLFEGQGHQPHPVAVQEAKRGTTDALYGYYTLGKLMILKLREDYRAKRGSQFSLQDFHDQFIKVGPLMLPLMRRAILGEVGALL